MKIDETAAAYGLFQLAFAEVTEYLAAALFRLRRDRETELEFAHVFRMKFSRMLSEFKEELKRFDGRTAVVEELGSLRGACSQMKALSQWRNCRSHARVRRVDDGLALYDWKTHKRLSITFEECEEKILEAGRVRIALMNVSRLVRDLEFDRLFEHLFSTLDDEGELEDAAET